MVANTKMPTNLIKAALLLLHSPSTFSCRLISRPTFFALIPHPWSQQHRPILTRITPSPSASSLSFLSRPRPLSSSAVAFATMPPKKQAVVATPIFQGCVFAASGNFPNYNQAEIGQLVQQPDAGAAFSNTVTKKITHLITTAADVVNQSTKVSKASSLDHVSIVSLDWILDSLKQKKKLDETAYKLDASPAASVPSASAPSSSPTPATPAAKSGGKRKADDENEDEDEEGVKVEKKIKLLKEKVSKSLSAPGTIKQPVVDNACTLPAMYSVYVDDEVAWNARLNQTNINANNNKFYLIQLLSSTSSQYAVFCHWGRVGAGGQSSTDMYADLASAQRGFERKYKDKTKNNWADRDNFVKHAGKI